MSECGELVNSAYNSVAFYTRLAESSTTNNRYYWFERAEKSQAIADKLNEAFTEALYDA